MEKIRSRLDTVRQTVHSQLELFDIFIPNCSCGVKNGGLFAGPCISVAQGREQGGGYCPSVANSGFILGELRCKLGTNCLKDGQSRPPLFEADTKT